MKIKMKDVVTAVLMVMVCFVASDVFAYGEQIGSALDRTTVFVTRILGGFILVIGLVWTGFRMAAHDEEALKKGILVIGGGLIIFLANNIVSLIKDLAGN